MSITVRMANVEDAEALLKIYANYVKNTAITFEYEVPSKEEFQERIKRIGARYPYLLAEEHGEILGYAYASSFYGRAAYDWSVETTVYVDKDRKKSGLGGKLYRAMEAILKLQGICNMNACIAIPREGSVDPYVDTNSMDFHRHLGFEKVGVFHDSGYKFQHWYDVVWMEKMIGKHEALQKEVKTVWDVDWKSCLDK